MPQLTLEFSKNIFEKNGMVSLLTQCHQFIAETLPTDIMGCKSRAIEHTCYCVGDGEANNAFVHVTLKVLPGRNSETLALLGNGIMEILADYFAESAKTHQLQITLEIDELPQTYFKMAFGMSS